MVFYTFSASVIIKEKELKAKGWFFKISLWEDSHNLTFLMKGLPMNLGLQLNVNCSMEKYFFGIPLISSLLNQEDRYPTFAAVEEMPNMVAVSLLWIGLPARRDLAFGQSCPEIGL